MVTSQPSAALRIKLGGTQPDLGENFLQGVLCFCPLIQHTDQHAQKFRAGQMIERGKGRAVLRRYADQSWG
jgi:hypothetical protein